MRSAQASRVASFTGVANAAWHVSHLIAGLLPTRTMPTPAWAPGPLPKSTERTSPPLGVPRRTQSLCPKCNAEAVEAVLAGSATVGEFRAQPGIIEAEIVEDGGRILMRKTCAKHGRFEDLMSTNPAFFRRMESLYVGQDFRCSGDSDVHNHGASAIRTGRGIALIVDLTNRCNLKCFPCYMDANRAGYVHELSMDDIRAIFDRARSFKPQREMNILFAGGEPTIAQNFLDAVRYARSIGFKRLYVATNGIRFGLDEEFAIRAREAGLHQVYLQLDGTSNEGNQHRGAANLFDVKLTAMKNIAKAGMRVNVQVAVVKTVNDHAIGDVMAFALENIENVQSVIFQPIMFTGRDANVEDEDRSARRYTLADLAGELERQTDRFEWLPMRDWYPMSAYSVFGNLFDHLNPNATVGSMYTDIHPNHGIFSPLLVNRVTKDVVPLAAFLNVDQLLRDIVRITDGWTTKRIGQAQLALAVLRNYSPNSAPRGFSFRDLLKLFESFGPRLRSDLPDWNDRDNADPEWRLLTVVGTWFQDLYNYDLSAIHMDPSPVATPEGEISFCAYNAAGWRKMVEHVHKTATLGEWHRSHGRHEIYANGAVIELTSVKGSKKRQDLVA